MGSATSHGLDMLGLGTRRITYDPQAAKIANMSQAAQAQAAQAQYNAMMQQNQYQQQHQMMRQYNQAYTKKKWMLDGKEMDFEEFIDTLYPEECAEKTYLILKLKGNEDA